MKRNTSNKPDFQKTITDKIIASLESGNVKPWVCPWTKSGENPVPHNHSTGNPYSGVNMLLLWLAADEENYTRNAWLTYKQASDLGGVVRKGQKGTHCVRPNIRKKEVEGVTEEVFVGYSSFTVFNVEQCDGLDLPEVVHPDYHATDAIQKIDAIAEIYAANTGVRLSSGGDRALYSPALDMIKMPRMEAFKSGDNYASTLAHELAHSTGIESRLNRFSKNSEAFDRQQESYAFEELVAALSESIICAEIGVDGMHDSHVSYIQSWLKHLREDKSFVFKAASAASKASKFVLDGGVKKTAVKADLKAA